MSALSVPQLHAVDSRVGPHGLSVTTSVLPTVPLVQAHLGIPADLTGAVDLAEADVLVACWPALPACLRFEQHGGTVDVGRRNHWLTLSLTCTSDRLPLLVEVVAQVLRARYTPEGVADAAARAARQAVLVGAQPAADSARMLWHGLFGQVPVPADPAPDAEHITAVTADAANAAHDRLLRPQQGHLVLAGDLDAGHTHRLIDEALAAWHPPAPGPARAQSPVAAPPSGITEHHRPGMAHAQIRLAAHTDSRRSTGQFAVDQIAAHILGGSFNSRINTVLREEEGLAYRTGASLVDLLDHDLLFVEADVDSARAPDAYAHLTRILDEFADDGPTDDELRGAVSHVLGKYALNLGTQAGQAACILSYRTVGFPLSAMNDLLDRLPHLTRDDVRAAAARFRSPLLTGVICGPAQAPVPARLPHAS